MRSADVLVVGAGVVGAFHAYHAAQQGYSVLLAERNPWPNDASMRNFGIIARSIVEPGSVWDDYARDTRDIYRAIQREHDITVRETGSLYLASTTLERAVLAEYATQADKAECMFIEGSEAVARYPFLEPEYCRGALLFPHDLGLDPRLMLQQLIPFLERTGRVTYLPRTTITHLEVSGGHCRAHDAAGNPFEAAHVFVCGGAERRILFPELFTDDAMRICKLQMLRTVPQVDFRLPHPVLSGLSLRRYPAFKSCPSHAAMCAEPVEEELTAFDIHLLIKQETDGTVVIGDSHEYRSPSQAADLEERTNPAITEAILRYARRMLRLPSWRVEAGWNGYYLVPKEQDSPPQTIGGRIHLAAPIGGRGMTVGPGYARRSIERALA
ncbi:MAG TPA: TIGR03364 family FAD-dependent oxidoreductase [Chloroflexota bacterium]